MSTGRVPKLYKTSPIAPLHKKGSYAIAANYRPVSLTSHVIKIYERVLRKQMVAHLEENNLLNSKQHGFRSGKSCLTQLLHHFDDIIESLSNGDDMDAIYLDYAKAFDKGDHQLLLSKLQLYGFHPEIMRWIESFLTNRSQQVIADGHISITAPIISGVPQGTVLGPILFLIFINDVDSCVSHSILRCFADDTRICRSISDLNNVHELQSDLEEVTKRDTAWHCMRISLSAYAILPTNVMLSTSFPLLMNIFNIQHQLAPYSLLLISSVIWALQFPMICPGHYTYDLVVIRRGRCQRGFSVSSTFAILGSC